MKNKDRNLKITNRERIYNFLVKYIQENGFSPSIREICEGTFLKSTSTVYRHLQRLEDEGRIEMKQNSFRAIKLVGYELKKMEK